MAWTLENLRVALNEAHDLKLTVVSFDLINETLTVKTRNSAQPWEAEAREIMRTGRKIDAIKHVRQHSGMGLAEAKDLVESWAP